MDTKPSTRRSGSKTIVLTGYGGYDKLVIEYRPVPNRPPPDMVVVQVKASGVNFAELMCRQGIYDKTPSVPAVLGMEAAGIIVDIGSAVESSLEVQMVTLP